MKTRKTGKMILALLLAVMMVLPSLAAIAEEAEAYEKKIKVENGTVSVADPGNDNWAKDDELTESKKLEGDLAIKIKDSSKSISNETALSVKSGKNASVDESEKTGFEVTGSVDMQVSTKPSTSSGSSTYVDAYVEGVSVQTSDGTSAQVTIGKDISVSTEAHEDYVYTDVYSLKTNSGKGAETNVSVGGNVQAKAEAVDKSENGKRSERATAQAVVANGNGGETIIEIGGSATADAAVPEGTATATAVLIKAEGQVAENSYQITVHEDATATATVGDKKDTSNTSTATASAVSSSVTKGQTVEVTVDGKASAEATNKGKGEAGAIAVNATVNGEDAKVTYTVGDVSATATGEKYANATAVSANVNSESAEATYTVSGDVSATATGSEFANVTAVYANVYGKSAEATYTVSGDVIATATGNDSAEATGINVEAKGKNETNITVNSVTAKATLESKEDEEGAKGAAEGGEANPEAKSEAEGVMVKATDGATVNVTVGEGGINASGDKSAMGIYATTSDAESSVKVTVQDGGVVAEGAEDEWVMGVNTVNEDGEITVNVIGDTVSSGTGIYASDTETINSDTEEDTREGGTTKVTVVGDVQAEDTAVQLELNEAKSTIEVTVDGTVEGKEHAIVLSEDTIAENLTMTVWEVKPNEDGNIVERVEYPEDGEGEAKYTADKETEKLIQYIVRIQDDSKPYIATTGTRDFTAGNGETYQVANEGDKVLVKLTIPEGKELVGAYWDKAQSDAGKLLTDSEGNYYVEVPRGGGVELSLVMKDIPKPEPEPEPQPEPVPETAKYSSAAPILTLKIQDGEVRIDFYRNGSFVVTLEDGSKEKGTYAFENDQLVLNCGSGKVQINADEPFTYTSSADASRTYQFKMSQADIETLKKK